jgi:hypothetical protein
MALWQVAMVSVAEESYLQAQERANILLQEAALPPPGGWPLTLEIGWQNAGNPAACEAIAEDEIKTVKSVCTGAQNILNQVNRGQLCAKLASASSGLHTFQVASS